jgi:hypothetical protein
MSDEVTTFTRNLAGRDIVFRHPIPAQLIVLRRKLLALQDEATRSDEDKQVDLSVQLIAYTLDVVESLIVNPDDAAFLEKAMMTGKVDHVLVMDVLAEKKPEAPKATRKRATAAKTVSNRARPKH